MEPIFDYSGQTVAWRSRDVIHDPAGAAIGWVRDRALFSREGRYLGRCEDGVYRNAAGEGIAFEREATGLLTPTPQPGPAQPMAELRPPEPRFDPAPAPPMKKVRWAAGGWEALFGPVSAR